MRMPPQETPLNLSLARGDRESRIFRRSAASPLYRCKRGCGIVGTSVGAIYNRPPAFRGPFRQRSGLRRMRSFDSK